MSKQLLEQEKDKINKWIKGGKKKKYTQLYSAASNGCDSSKFHTNCDNKGPTVSLVYNLNGSVYGGYSSVSWRSGSGESVYDGDAFLFLMTGGLKSKSCKFTIILPEYALTMNKDFGPSFGKGPDLLTFSGDVTRDTNSFHLNSVMVPDSYDINEKTINEITGGSFDAVDVVVYAVEDVAEDIILPTPWRQMDLPTWDSKLEELLKREIEEYWPLREMNVPENEIPYVNVLLLGPVGSGKSSFFNTLNSIFRNRVSIQARAGSSENSLTKSFNVYSIISNTKTLRFRICDCRGFEDAHEIDQYDIEAILDGNIKSKYTFVDKSRITRESPYFRRYPKMHDRIHSVAIVVDANNDPDYPMTDRVHEQMKKTQELLNQKGVPQLILMNKIDCLSDSIRMDLSCTFHSPDIKDRVEKLANSLRLPPYTVLPMKNIDSEQCLNENINILTLYNLRQMLRAADDYLLNYLPEFQGDKIERNYDV